MAFHAALNRAVARRLSFIILSTACALSFMLCLAPPAGAQSADLVTTSVNNSDRAMLRGHHPVWANDENDAGAVPPDTKLESLALVLSRPAQAEQAFQQFLRDQQNPSSPNFHHWLTPVEIGERFGNSAHDIDAIKSWLESQNLHVDSVSSSMTRIRFSGPASAIGNAFGAEMHFYTINGEKRISISSEAQIPAALAPVIQSVTGLYTINIRPMHGAGSATATIANATSASSNSPLPDFTVSCNGVPCFFVTPADFAQIYSLNLPYQNGFHGEGQTIAIIGRSAVNPADITNFQLRASLPQVAPTVIVPPNGVTPPAPATSPVTNPSEDQLEATLDVTRAGGVAYNATIDLVISAATATTGGIDVASEYVIDTTPVPAHIMNISFGACEANAGAGGVQFWDSLFQQAASEGISVFVSSGDAGVAGCDTNFATPPANQIASPNYICSSSFATCVGGTEFADTANPNLYWRSGNSGGFESALSYIPEGAWNEPFSSNGGFQAGATAGGVSLIIPTPSWQTGPGVPSPATGRYTPDIAFSSAAHDGYFACFAAAGNSCVGTTSFQFEFFFGTSAAAPDMAGITALLNQSTGKAQGNLNPILYQIAAATNSNGVFNDVTVASSAVSNCVVTTPSMCNNTTPAAGSLTGGLSGFLVGPGFDEATGLGSINVANLLANWNNFVAGTIPSSTAVTTTMTQIGAGGTISLNAVVTTAGPVSPSGTVKFFDGTSLLGLEGLGAGAIPPVFQAGTTFFTNPLGSGTHSITAVYSGDSNFLPSTSPVLTVTASGNNPAPSLQFLETTSGVVGQPIPSFAINGNSFIPGATINFGGTNFPATITFSGGLIITASIPAGAINTPGPIPVFVVNPGPGGGPSNITNFNATNPAPTVTSMNPSSGSIGQAVPALTVTGTNFVTGAVVTFNGTSHAGTVSNGGTTITTSIAGTELAIGGTVSVNVVNPAPGGGTSNNLNFTINNLVPVITSVNPASGPVGQAIPALTVTGTNIASGAVVRFGGNDYAGTVSNGGTTITVNIPANQLPTGGIVPVLVTNPTPGGGSSNSLSFTINNPVPTLTSISPNTAPIGSAVSIIATGTGFQTGASLVFNGVSVLGTATNNGATLTATVPATSLVSVGTATVTVSNPTPGGGPSNALNFVIDDFSVSGPTQAVTITAGQSANFSFSFATQGGTLPAAVNFGTANLPPQSSASFTPPSLLAGIAGFGNIGLTITTTAHTGSTVPASRRVPANRPLDLVWFSLFVLVFMLIQRSYRAGRSRLQLRGAAALLVFCAVLIAGCGSGSTVAPPPTTTTGTSAGTYTISVSATSGTSTRTTAVTLIVQ